MMHNQKSEWMVKYEVLIEEESRAVITHPRSRLCFWVNKDDDHYKKNPYPLNEIQRDAFLSLVPGIAAIRVFLSDENEIRKGLKKLNRLLEEEIAKRKNNRQDNHKKLLRSVLENELAKLGFQVPLKKAVDILSQPEFLNFVLQGLLLKDPGAGLSHGEFTHIIQWLLIAWGNEEHHFLKGHQSAVDFFQKIGTKDSGNNLSEIHIAAAYSELWIIAVDEAIPDSYSQKIEPEFTSPISLHQFILRDDKNDFNQLQNQVRLRDTKRHHQQGVEPSYVSKSMFGNNMSNSSNNSSKEISQEIKITCSLL